jgi:hypothetical protein
VVTEKRTFLGTKGVPYDREALMRRLLLLIVLIAIVSGAALAPQGMLGQPNSKKDNSPPPFSISISGAPVLKVGEPFVISIRLTNLSDHPLDTPNAWMGSFDAVYAFDIRDSTGTQLAWHAQHDVTYLIGTSGTLDPGKTKVEDQAIEDFFDVNKPGTYEMRVKRCIDLENPEGSRSPKCDESKGMVWSNKITVTVVPATRTAPTMNR